MTSKNTSKAELFYEERDRRTIEYINNAALPNASVKVAADAATCCSEAGQLALTTLANLLSRSFRNVRFALAEPNAILLTKSLCGACTIGDDVFGVATRADPFGSFRIESLAQQDGPLSICVKTGASTTGWYLGFDRALASLAKTPQATGNALVADCRGALLAAVLGSATAFKEALGMVCVPRQVSAWNFQEGAAADPGPDTLNTVDVGRVLVVGAGAVASGLAYCLWHWGADGEWALVDQDLTALHNTNRSLLFFPDQTDWSGETALYKARCLEKYFPNAEIDIRWYDESAHASQSFDTVLGLANERAVRTLLARRNDPVQLQATTGRSWLSQLHRHVAGVDDCMRCRMDDVEAPRLTCSTAPLPTLSDHQSADAALPFLSIASGLMLTSYLQQLSLGLPQNEPRNTWRWDFRSERALFTAGRHSCRADCDIALPPAIQAAIAQKTLWFA